MRFFWDAERHRLRAGVRIAIHLLALAAMLFVVSLAGATVPAFVLGPIAFGSVIAITAAAARWLDHRPITDLGLRVDGARLIDLGAGMLVGGGAIGLVAILEMSLGVADYAARPSEGHRAVTVAFVALFFGGVAIQEELVFRGYQLVNLTEGLVSARLRPARAAALATFLSAAAFGLAHAGNEGATILSTIQVAVAGGSLLAVGFVLTGDLAFSIGLHFAWNFAQCVLGMPVSGFVIGEAQLLTRTPHGSEWLTGGAFGPEASLLGMIMMLLGTAASVSYVKLRYGSLALRLRVAEATPSPASSELPSGER